MSDAGGIMDPFLVQERTQSGSGGEYDARVSPAESHLPDDSHRPTTVDIRMRSAPQSAMDSVPVESERSLVGALIMDWRSPLCRAARSIVSPEDFGDPVCNTVAHALWEMDERGLEPSLPMAVSHLRQAGELEKCGGQLALVQICEEAVSDANAPALAKIVREWRVRRILKARSSQIAAMASDGSVPATELFSKAMDLTAGLGSDATDTLRMCDIVLRREDSEKIRTGYPALDKDLNGGYPVGECSYVMGPTGRGKTCWLLWAAHTAASRGVATAFCTYEMPGHAIKRRLLRHMCGWDHPPLVPGADEDAYAEALSKLDSPDYPMVVYDPSARPDASYTVQELERWLSGRALGLPPKLVVVDYYQKLGSTGRFQGRHEELSFVARRLSHMAKKFSCAILMGSQITQDDAGSRVRGSREGENEAAVILEIDKAQTGVKIVKARHGRSGSTMPVRFDPNRLVFVPVNPIDP